MLILLLLLIVSIILVKHFVDCSEEALTHYLAAFKILRDDPDVIMAIVDTYSSLAYFNELDKFIELLPDSDIKTLSELLSNPKITTNKLKELRKENIPDTHHSTLLALNLVADYNGQILKCKQIDKNEFVKRLINLEKKGVTLSLIFSLAVHCKLHDFMKDKLALLPEEIIKNSPYLLHLKCLIDNSDQNLAKTINSCEIEDSKKIELHTQAASSLLANENEAGANIEYAKMSIVHANEGLKLDPTNQDLLEIAHDAAFLAGEKEQMQEFKKALRKAELEQILNVVMILKAMKNPWESLI